MDIIGLLISLGVNSTFYQQFVLIAVTCIILHHFLFKPYYEAYSERIQRTEGNQQTSERVLVEAEELKNQFENKTRELNEAYKAVYDETRSEALKDYDKITIEARDNAKKLLDETRSEITLEFDKAKLEVAKQVPEVSGKIVDTMLQ